MILIVFFIILMLIVVTKFIKKYKSTYTIFEKTSSIDTSKIKAFHQITGSYLQDIQKNIIIIKDDKYLLSFKEFIDLQEKYRAIVLKSLNYDYLPSSSKGNLELIQKNLIINFHNINYTNLEEILTGIEDIIIEIEEAKQSIMSHTIFKNYNKDLEFFYNDLNDFMKYCKLNTKNVVLSKLNNLIPVSSFELNSFEESFSHIVNRKVNYDSSIYGMYELILEIFNEKNIDVLQPLKKVELLYHKLQDQELKLAKLEDRIDTFMEILVNLQSELFVLSTLTEKTSKYSVIFDPLAKFIR